MKIQKTALPHRARSLRLGVALILTTIMLLTVAATTAQAQTFTKLYDFGATTDLPQVPQAQLVQGRDGNLYSTTMYGGAYKTCGAYGMDYCGAVYELTPAGILTVVHNFNGSDGSIPQSGVALGTDGALYGSTNGNGRDYGNIFKIASDGSMTIVYKFKNCKESCWPSAALVQGTDGSLYGTSTLGPNGNSTVYKMTPDKGLTVLHVFDASEGRLVTAPLIQGTNGDFYGTSAYGGAFDWGTVFKITPAGDFAVLHNFDNTNDGAQPNGLTQGADGNLYGSDFGAASGLGGALFKMTPAGDVIGLHTFGVFGWDPMSPPVQATDRNFYGTTRDGNPYLGTIYRIAPDGTFSYLYIFPSDGTSGALPVGMLVQHTNGLLYGTTTGGGAYSKGVFFSFDLGLPPFVRLVSTSGQIGKSIGVLGQAFTGATTVAFNGVPATFSVVSDTYLEASVPDGALTGSVTVTTPTGTLSSNTPFRVTPKILSFNPTSGTAGTAVVISGTGFTQTLRVGFGGIPATSLTIDSDTHLTAIVPDNAVTGKVAVATQGGHDTSARAFTVTP